MIVCECECACVLVFRGLDFDSERCSCWQVRLFFHFFLAWKTKLEEKDGERKTKKDCHTLKSILDRKA